MAKITYGAHFHQKLSNVTNEFCIFSFMEAKVDQFPFTKMPKLSCVLIAMYLYLYLENFEFSHKNVIRTLHYY
jgi:hypothetical protein